MDQAYVILNRPPASSRDMVLYVIIAASPAEAIAAVKAKVNPGGDLEVNGRPLAPSTAEALNLQPGEVRRL